MELLMIHHVIAALLSVWSVCSTIVLPVAAVDIIAPILIDDIMTQRSPPHHLRRRRDTTMNITVNAHFANRTNTSSDIIIASGQIIAHVMKTNVSSPSVSIELEPSPTTAMTPQPSRSNQVVSTFRNGSSTTTQPRTTPPPFPSVSLEVSSHAPFPSVQLIPYPSYSPNYDEYVTKSPYTLPVSPTVPTQIEGEIRPFTTLTCNANLTRATCQTWTSVFGTFNTYATLITIPCGTCIVMDFNNSTNGSSTSLELLGGLDIHGKLIFPDTTNGNNNTLSVTTTMMIVQGELSMTSMTKPINGQPNIRITLIGENVNQTFVPIDNNAMACTLGNASIPTPCKIGKKAIVVAGGKVSIRGIPANTKAWTRLYDAVGSNYSHPDTIYLEDTNIKEKWSIGAEIVMTSHTRNPDDAQVRTIVSISAAPVSGYSAYKLNESIARPTTIVESPEMAVEVALLSRNIVFEGGSDTTTYHGGHLMIFHTPIITQVIEGIEIKNFGQQGLLGRYPIHFHYCDDVPGSVIRKNAIRQSNQRCVVIHGTNKLRVEENVAFDAKGHCYMTEDGIEIGNEFIRNLGAQIGVPERLIPESTTLNNGIETDNFPAVYWITNPDQIFIGNVAAGSHDSGFWFEPKLRGVRQSRYAGYDPRIVPTRIFKDNVVHSCTARAGAIRTYTPGYSPASIVTLDGVKSYRNFVGIEIHRTVNIRIANSFFADNIISIDIDRTVGVEITNTTVIGESDSYRMLRERQRNIEKMCDRSGKRVGIELHTWAVETNWVGAKISNVTFLGFDKTLACSKAASIKYDGHTLKQGLFEFYSSFQDMRILDGPSSVDFCIVNEDEHSMVYTIDLDGSMKPSAAIQTTMASTLVGSDDGRLLDFVDTSKCSKVDAGCYSYCTDTCFRSMRFDLYIPSTDKYSLRVCLRYNRSKCTTFDGGRRNNTRSYTLVAHLPVGNAYDAIFVASNGSQASPPFQQSVEQFFCSIDRLFEVVIVDGGITVEVIDPTPRGATIFQRIIAFFARILQLFQRKILN